ncbi:dual oxidase maturation factor 1-like [Saccostrea echinata]|uniref:dual oxidase maturation factor 1-like n=1 Tax=Saccostrea echinata TaxID=191078 RepID=UPI002A837C21|nr:dual oxidase maturation factor 1-like [Saccostrea echinata]
MTWFSAFRGDFGFSFYGQKRTPVTIDIQLVSAIYACVLVSVATIIVALGIRGKERWINLIRVVFSLGIGTTIILASLGYCWQFGEVQVKSTYIYRSEEQFSGTLGMFVGLRRINITLSGNFNQSKGEINYNEAVDLENVRGPIQELRHCLGRGLPIPVLHLVEYLSTDTGGLRWGRSYTGAGYLSHILLWTSFSFWILTNIMMVTVVFYGAFLLTLTGITMILACVTFHVLQPRLAFRIMGSDVDFVTYYGPCFWAVLAIGIITTIIGFVIVCLDYKVPKIAAKYILIEKPFVKEDVYTSVHRKSIANVPQQKYDLQKMSSDGMINLGFDHNEMLQTRENHSSGQHDQMKRCNTTPGKLSLSPEPSPVRRGSLPVRNSASLNSINEHESEGSNESPRLHRSPPQYCRNEMNIQMTTCPTIEETERLDRLREIYIDVDMQQNSLQRTFNAL